MARHQENVGARRQVREQPAFLNDITDLATQPFDVCLRNL